MADITFKHVVKTYDKGNTVVPDLNLEIKEQRVCCSGWTIRLWKINNPAYDRRTGGGIRR